MKWQIKPSVFEITRLDGKKKKNRDGRGFTPTFFTSISICVHAAGYVFLLLYNHVCLVITTILLIIV